MTATKIANVPTTSGSRHLQQLCKHWGHKMPVEFTPEQGTITFPSGVVTTMTAFPEHLEVRLDLPDANMAEQMQGVVQRHLDRFAFREAPLSFDWRDVE
ncbi:MAG: DUF2218 domain-containing protein [Sphingorhabdus sp.]